MVTLREILNLKQESASFIKLLNWMRLSPRMVLRVPIIMCFILSFRRERVISIRPTYQQLYSIPESYGADVQLIDLKKENGYLPDIEEIRRLATPETKMICPLILIRFVKKCTSRQVLLSRQGTVLNSRTA